jgi:hypothetical protein
MNLFTDKIFFTDSLFNHATYVPLAKDEISQITLRHPVDRCTTTHPSTGVPARTNNSHHSQRR